MATFSGLEIGLSFLFGCVFLGLAAELYYLLWWKRRHSKRSQDFESQHFSSSNFTPGDLSSTLKTPNSSKSLRTHEQNFLQSETENQEQDDLEMGLKKELILKGLEEESLDLELMRVHNLSGPPRFLFTINEETREDLESERSRKGSRTNFGTPFLSPQASSPLKAPQKLNLGDYPPHGLKSNPLFESNEFEFDFDKLRSSPPPTFKFLRDAEEKLLRRLMQAEKEEEFSTKTEDGGEDGAFVKLGAGKGKKGIQPHHIHQVSTASQVLPLASSPSTIVGSIEKKL